MIGTLRGVVIDREPALDRAAATELTIEVAGVGYRVSVTAATLSRLPADEAVLLFVHHHIREADQKLYGFTSKDERTAFEGLISAHGVGPALALAVLATHPVQQLARILADEDLAALCEVPGVGKKTAERLLVELRSSINLPVLDGGPGPDIDLTDLTNGDGSAGSLADVREALTNLGYSSQEIRRAVAAVSDELAAGDAETTADSGQLLKLALLKLSSG